MKCVSCHHRIWPWQSRGELFRGDGVAYWHSGCPGLISQRVQDRLAALREGRL